MQKLGIVLRKTEQLFENRGVLNPAVIQVNGQIHMFYRAISSSGTSTIGHCILSSPLEIAWRSTVPILWPEFEFEQQGMEDPRVVCIDGLYYLTYTAFDGLNALGALATSIDLIHWDKRGILVPRITLSQFKKLINSDRLFDDGFYYMHRITDVSTRINGLLYLWDKNLIFFPRKIGGKFCFVHRIKPDIQIVWVNNLEDLTEVYWKHYLQNIKQHVLISPKYEHESNYVGGGCPPIETPMGWLFVYHGVSGNAGEYIYSACVSLLSLTDPTKEIARLHEPLFTPDFNWEVEGIVDNVCFPTGAIVENNTLYIYYGAADERIAVFSVLLNELLDELMKNINPENQTYEEVK